MTYRKDIEEALRELAVVLEMNADRERHERIKPHIRNLSEENWKELSEGKKREELNKLKDTFYWRAWEPRNHDGILYSRIVELIDNYRYNFKI